MIKLLLWIGFVAKNYDAETVWPFHVATYRQNTVPRAKPQRATLTIRSGTMHMPYEDNPLGLPWALDEEAASGEVIGCRTIEDCAGLGIANTHGLADDEEDAAIADHIIKSANLHGQLVAALLDANVALHDLSPVNPDKYHYAREKVREALTAAGVPS
jgi:hypothetical protein